MVYSFRSVFYLGCVACCWWILIVCISSVCFFLEAIECFVLRMIERPVCCGVGSSLHWCGLVHRIFSTRRSSWSLGFLCAHFVDLA